MGMFDFLRVQHALPSDLPPPSNAEFQTKDTDAQYLERYTITADGRLVHHAVRYEETPLDKLPYPDRPIIGSITRVPIGDVEVSFHGDLEFCHYDCSTKARWDYIARFTEGRCVRIWLDEYEPPTTAPAQPGAVPLTKER